MNAAAPAAPHGHGAPTILLLPGWLDSAPTHWQSRWEALHGDLRVTQSDWQWPRRGDWMARLDEVVQAQRGEVALVAHSLGCQLVAAWAAHTSHAGRVRAALLVAPPDVEREDMPPPLHAWRPIVRARLPFASLAVLSSDDPYCSPEHAQAMVADWGCEQRNVGARGHLNDASGLGDWPEARRWLEALIGVARPVPDAQRGPEPPR